MTPMARDRVRTGVLIGAASLVLGLATTAGLAAATGGGQAVGGPLPAAPSQCNPPALPGSVVDVTFTDMGAMMGPAMNGTGPGMMGPGMMGPGMNGGPMMGQGPWPNNGMGMGMGMMQIGVNPRTVPAGTVSLRAFNRGAMLHEVVVLPLTKNQTPGQRPVGADWKADEAGSLGEAAQTCGSGDGDGVAPGAWSWTTLNLPPGRYELMCNIPGHYSSGMYTELDVT